MDRRKFLKLGLGAASSLLAAPFGTKPVAPVRAAHPRRGGSPKRVLVVGAGMAGLAAAYELTERGHDVTILEARTRPGGRVLTLRQPFADGLYAEAGPVGIPNHHDLPRHYAALFGVPLEPSVRPEGTRLYYAEGRRIVLAPGTTPTWPEGYRITQEEEALGRRGRTARYIDPVLDALGDPAAPGWPSPEALAYDQMTYADFLRSRGASEGYVARTRIGFRQAWGDGIDTYSALDGLRSLALERAWQDGSVVSGGMDGLPKAFARHLGRHIRYGHPVVRVEQDAEGVRAIVQRGGTHTPFEADRLVLAIPFSVLRTMEVAPAFSPAKQRAVNELMHSSVARLYLQFRERFWRDEGLAGMAWTDLPIGRILNRTADQPGLRGLLEAYATGPHARHLTAMPEADRLPFFLDQLARVFPRAPEFAEGGTSKCWDEDPWARGEYCWFRPGDFSALYPHLAPAEGRLHFAGEQTSPWPGWMQGALTSGRRAAQEVHEATD